MSGALVFGKMPSHGDFVARGLTAEDKESLDMWLSAEMDSARARLGDRFEDLFDTAPPWRFAWSDSGWTAGAFVGSVDSVGRRFPLIVARAALAPGEVEAAGDLCEDSIYEAFEGGWTVDQLLTAVSDGALSDGGAEPFEGWWTHGSEEFGEARLPGPRPAGLMLGVLGGESRAAA